MRKSIFSAGDLVELSVTGVVPGAITAVKYFARLQKKCGEKQGVVLHVIDSPHRWPNAVVMYSTFKIKINTRYLKKIDQKN